MTSLIGPKTLAARLECDARTARAILAAIADVEVNPGVHRLTEEAYERWIRDRMSLRAGQENNTNAQIPRRPQTIRRTQDDPNRDWTCAEELLRGDS